MENKEEIAEERNTDLEKEEAEEKERLSEDIDTSIEMNSNPETKKLEDKNNKKQEKNKKAKRYKEKKETKKRKSKMLKIIVIALIIIIVLAGGSVFGYFAYQKYSKKFKDVSIELGTETVELKEFVVDEKYLENAKFITDMSTIGFSKTGSYEVELCYDEVNQKVILNIVDTTAPVVEFQDIDKYVDYELNADDFIKSKTDLSEMTASIINPPEITGIGTYEINVEVKDSSNNVTSNICALNVSRVVKEFNLELGEELEKKDILLNYDEDKDAIKQSQIDEINEKGAGEYELALKIDGDEEIVKIIIEDTKAPSLELKNVTIYDDEKVSGKNAFIKSAKDASGKVTTTLKTEIDYSKLGKQEIKIEAEDKYGNKVEKTATLTIKKDTDGPVFSGLSSMSVAKNSSVNYKKGVKAVDKKDGSCDFTVDSSKVNLSKAGTYYATYTAKDKKGNTTTKRRKITVNHNQEDTNNKFNEFYKNYLSGKSVQSMVSTIRSKIKYNSSWGGSDPVWYGLTNYTGNCYVHALLVQKALNKAGITNKLIYTTDKSHYWNLVYQNGVWRHYDATPGNHLLGPATDEEKASSSSMKGRTWSDSFPKAE